MKQERIGLPAVLLISFTALIAVLCLASTVSATNGYFSHGYSVKSKAMGGVGTALPLDSLAASTNPAGMVFVGSRIDFGLSAFNPNREYTVKGSPTTQSGLKPGTVESDSKWFFIPSFGVNKMMSTNYSLGLSVFGNGGMNTDYDESTYNRFGDTETGVDLAQLFIVPTYARKLHAKHAIGISPVFAYQYFEAKGVHWFAPLSQNSTRLSDNGHDDSFGYGGRIGYFGEIFPGFFLGASYQTKIWMSQLDDYRGLFAEDGNFDIPSNWSVGLAYNIMPSLTLAVDVQQIYYSDVDSVHNEFNPAFRNCAGATTPPPFGAGASPSDVSYCLGGDKGIGFGWDDMTVFKIGAQWQSSPAWTWRAGYSYSEQPIASSEVLFNILAPGVIEHHASVGLTRAIGNNKEINVAVAHAFENSEEGKNPNDPNQMIELQMNQWEFTVGFAMTF